MNKRDYNLDPAVGFNNTYSIKTDKSGNLEAVKVAASEIVVAGGGIISSTISDTTISNPDGTATVTYAKRYKIGSMVTYTLDFAIDFNSTDPEFTLGDIFDASILVGAVAVCTVSAGAGDPVTYPCVMTNRTPGIFTVYGVFGSGTSRQFKITLTSLVP